MAETKDMMVMAGKESANLQEMGETSGSEELKTHVMAGINFQILKTELTACFQKNTEGFQILVFPTDQESDKGMTVREMIDELKKLLSKSGAQLEEGGQQMEQDITNAITDISDPENSKSDEEKKKFDPLALEVCLQQVFLYYKKSGSETTFEYAFKFELDLGSVLPDFGLISVDKLFVAVWNTNRKKILQKMGLCDIDEVLEEFE